MLLSLHHQCISMGSAQLKEIINRLYTPMRNDFKVKKLALILVGAAVLPELFDSIKIQYQLVLNFFKLEDAGMGYSEILECLPKE